MAPRPHHVEELVSRRLWFWDTFYFSNVSAHDAFFKLRQKVSKTTTSKIQMEKKLEKPLCTQDHLEEGHDVWNQSYQLNTLLAAEHKYFLGTLVLCFRFVVMSPVGFKARVGSLFCQWQKLHQVCYLNYMSAWWPTCEIGNTWEQYPNHRRTMQHYSKLL